MYTDLHIYVTFIRAITFTSSEPMNQAESLTRAVKLNNIPDLL